jgi:hypothetical protein
MKALLLKSKRLIIGLVLFVAGIGLYRAYSWLDIYNQCLDSPFQSVHPDNLQPITPDNIDQLQRAEVFVDQLAEHALFAPSGQILITDTGIDPGFHSSFVWVTNLAISCKDHHFMVFGGGRRALAPSEMLRGGYTIDGCLQGLSTDGEWLVVRECGSYQRRDAVHRVQLRTGHDTVMTMADYLQWAEETGVELTFGESQKSRTNGDRSLEVQIIEDQFERVVILDTATGEIVRELPTYDHNPCDYCDGSCGVYVAEVFFSSDDKYLVFRTIPYCYSGYVSFLSVWIVPDG